MFQDLPKGTVGKVLSIDAEGDAYIDFAGSIGKQWVRLLRNPTFDASPSCVVKVLLVCC